MSKILFITHKDISKIDNVGLRQSQSILSKIKTHYNLTRSDRLTTQKYAEYYGLSPDDVQECLTPHPIGRVNMNPTRPN